MLHHSFLESSPKAPILNVFSYNCIKDMVCVKYVFRLQEAPTTTIYVLYAIGLDACLLTGELKWNEVYSPCKLASTGMRLLLLSF